MAFLNVVSLLLHTDEILFMLSQNYFDILALNETRLDQYYVFVQGYDIVRHDRHVSMCAYRADATFVALKIWPKWQKVVVSLTK